jgi:hypothetical protein
MIYNKTNTHNLDKKRKNVTFNGCVSKIDEKNPVRIDVNHFWVLSSPNSMPRAIIKRIETPTKIIQSPYTINIHHQGKVNEDLTLLFFSSTSLWLKQKKVLYIFHFDFYKRL